MSKLSKAAKWVLALPPQEQICTYCRNRVFAGNGIMSPFDASIDHNIPKCRGGVGGKINEVLSCALCNGAKDDMTGDEFMHFLNTGEIAESYVEYLAKRLRRLLAGRVRLKEANLSMASCFKHSDPQGSGAAHGDTAGREATNEFAS